MSPRVRLSTAKMSLRPSNTDERARDESGERDAVVALTVSPRVKLSNAKISLVISDVDKLALSKATHPPPPSEPSSHPTMRQLAPAAAPRMVRVTDARPPPRDENVRASQARGRADADARALPEPPHLLPLPRARPTRIRRLSDGAGSDSAHALAARGRRRGLARAQGECCSFSRLSR